MARSEVAQTLHRLIKLMSLLPSGAVTGKSATVLHQQLQEAGFDVEKRTVERDLQTLREAFAEYIDCDDRSKPYGWRWHKDKALEIQGMSVPEALSLVLVEDALKPLLPASMQAPLTQRFARARALLRDLEPRNRRISWARKIRQVQPCMPCIPPEVDGRILAAVQESLIEDEQVEVHYQSLRREAPKAMTLNPLALVQRGAISYLVATVGGYDDVRLFAMHRLHDAQRTYRAGTRPDGFDIDSYIAQGQLQFGDSEATGEEITLKAEVADWLATVLREAPLHIEQSLVESGGRWVLTAQVRDTRQLQWWVLSQGAAITVHEPIVLRHRITKVIEALATAYGQR